MNIVIKPQHCYMSCLADVPNYRITTQIFLNTFHKEWWSKTGNCEIMLL